MSSTRQTQLQLQRNQQAVLDQDVETPEQIQERRAQEIHELEQNMAQVADLMQDAAMLIQLQQPLIDEMGNTLGRVQDHVVKASGNVEAAERKQNRGCVIL